MVTAPPPDKLFAKSTLGISIWTLILQRKFEFFIPLHRVLSELRSYELHLSAGTITDGLQKLEPLFRPLYELLVEHNRAEGHWHCDETRWLVFVKQPKKVGFCWNLWVFAAKQSIVYVLDPTRSQDVPELSLRAPAKNPTEQDAGPTPANALAYAEADRQVRAHVEKMRARRDQELSQDDVCQPQRKPLKSLVNHWPGLTVFLDHPEVPLDNNEAERRERGPVIGRKNFYGSGTLWSGRLWNLDVAQWLTDYLSACAKAGGNPPADPQHYLPWNMTPQERGRLHPTQPKTSPQTAEPDTPAAGTSAK